MLGRLLALILGALMLSACAGGGFSMAGANVATGADAYRVLATPVGVQPTAPPAPGEYRIAAYDSITVAVFQEPELSTGPDNPLQVDGNGNVSLPLVGTLPAAGKTSDELSAAIAARLRGKYLKDPLVTVTVASTAPQKITVQGEVSQPGIYDFKGKTSLLQAIAMARGETRVAATREVAVFRNVNGQRLGAMFDLDAIRRGAAPDPVLVSNDMVIVGHSTSKQMWQQIMSINPVWGVFRVINMF